MDKSLSKLWEIVKDREPWHATVHAVTKSQTSLSDWTTTMPKSWLLFFYSVMSNSLWSHGLQHTLSFTISSSLLKLMSIGLVMPSNHLVLRCPLLLLLQTFPESECFPMSQLFTSGGQSIGASASVLPMNIQGWFPLGLTGFISLLSKGLSRISSNTTLWKHQFFYAQPSILSNSIIRTWLLEKP